MNEIESLFEQYLRNLCLKRNAQSAENSMVTAKVMERKLSMVPHNTWKEMGQEAMISLNYDSQGKMASPGTMTILDFRMNDMVALIVKLHYRVKIMDNIEGDRMQDFVIGQTIHLPSITEAGNIVEIET